MKKQFLLIGLALLLLASVSACTTDTPWRKMTVTTYELTGITIDHSRSTAEALKAQNLITDAQFTNIKAIYNKAQAVFVAAGNTLKLAGKAEDSAKRDALLAEYDKLLADFKKLAYELMALVNQFKK